MDVIKDPRSYEKNKKYYNILVHMLNESGSCLIFDCRDCPFSFKKYLNVYTDGLGCHMLDNFPVEFNSYSHCKMYYIARVISMYTEAEKLTYLIQDS